MKPSLRPFHLAFPVDDLAAAEDFYQRILGCETGRRSEHWLDFNFYGHQIVAHLAKMPDPLKPNDVDTKQIPVPHFGIILEWPDWEALAARLQGFGVTFIVEPYVRFAGQIGEQATMFFSDPAGNALEIKAFRNDTEIFAR